LGPDFESRGIISVEPPRIRGQYTVLVPRNDPDGNDLGCLLPAEVAVPVATYTGWNLRRREFGAEAMLVSLAGSYIPFPKTRAEREATGDPRRSLEERYGSFAGYKKCFAAVCDDLVKRRYLLKEDADRLMAGREKLRGLFPAEKSTGTRAPARRRGFVKVEETRPGHFPHRICAPRDFEGRTADYAWFGPAETKNIPRYPGNVTALGVSERPYQNFAALMTGINPVPGPRMGKVNKLYLRYFIKGSTEATFQYFSLTREDNNHIHVSGLTEGKWSELTLNFTRDAQRNDGSPEPFAEGERMDDLKVFVGKPGDGKRYELYLDDIILFAEDPQLLPNPEPFPNRVIFLAAFDTGPKERYWPGEFEIVEKNLPADSYWRVARSVPQKEGKGKWIRLEVSPPRPVGERTKLRFRYHLTGASAMTVQMFDATDQDNRHIHVRNLKEGAWAWANLDFTADSKRNDGSNKPFAAGNKVDDIFFFVTPDGNNPVELLIDEVVLYDAGKK